MSSQNDEYEIVDPELVEALERIPKEDPLITEYGTAGKGGQQEAIDFVSQWFPQKDNWQGKTKINENQAKALALFRHLPELFDEIEDLQGFIEGFTNNYEQYLTSVDGESRIQHTEILKALFGKSTANDETESLLRKKIFMDMESEQE